ncbi:MAG: hypothetical protein IJG30_08135 [Synergistaceae bacterium]|nr:hypothetical protein [Synergistaceae bacterium]
MAVSSIFHNVILRTPEQVEAFIRACEASEADLYVKPAGYPVHRLATREEIRELWKVREKAMMSTNGTET